MRPTPMTDTQQKAEAMEHGELIARLEAASEGSRELDALIFRAIGAPLPERFASLKLALEWQDDGTALMPVGEMRVRYEPPAYTTSLDAIVALIERSNWKLYSVDASVDGRPSCFIKGPDRLWPADDESDEHFGPGWEHGRAKSLPLALCIALLRALRTQDQGDQTNGS